MADAHKAPFTWDEIELELREVLWAQAHFLDCMGPDPQVACNYLGLDFDTWDDSGLREASPPEAELLRLIDPTRHALYPIVREAYLYAYQLAGFEKTSSDTFVDVEWLLSDGSKRAHFGDPTPLADHLDRPLAVTLRTFMARWNLFEYDDDMTIAQLALLSGMKIPALRTSLSKEGFRLETRHGDDVGRLNSWDAKRWLVRRRGFIPQLGTNERWNKEPDAELIHASTCSALESLDRAFPDLLNDLLLLMEDDPSPTRLPSDIDAAWVKNLRQGRSAEIDIPALRRLALALNAPEAAFSARAVRHLLDLGNS